MKLGNIDIINPDYNIPNTPTTPPENGVELYGFILKFNESNR